MLDVNTTSAQSTHFLRGVELIKEARGYFQIPSENWPRPTRNRFGTAKDSYYAEVWVDGMDWQPSFWLIESANFHPPVCQPLLVFESNKEADAFNSYDFEKMVEALLCYRRSVAWKSEDYHRFGDTVWPYLRPAASPAKKKVGVNVDMGWYSFGHASQEPVNFHLNVACTPR